MLNYIITSEISSNSYRFAFFSLSVTEVGLYCKGVYCVGLETNHEVAVGVGSYSGNHLTGV